MEGCKNSVVIIGAGPAGLTAAYELVKRGEQPLVLEQSDTVGGISRTDIYKGYRIDIGGHRFYTKSQEVQDLWLEVLGDNFLSVRRMSRIFYRGKFYDYPLNLFGTLKNLGVYESIRIVLSYLKWKTWPQFPEENFEEWVTNRFGRRLYLHFFKTYTEKVWGIPCKEIRADWAAQRIQGMSLKRAVMNALFGGDKIKSLIKNFQYPMYGPGQMWETFQSAVERRGGTVTLNTGVSKIGVENGKVDSITTVKGGVEQKISTDHLISSMPITELIKKIDPPAPDYALTAAENLKYRDFLIVCLIVDNANLFPDNWIYIHTPGVNVGRIQNFRNWSEALVPDASKSSLGMEYFCSEGDEIWEMADEDLIKLASKELNSLRLGSGLKVVDGTVIRQKKAYPVYDGTYKENVDILRKYLSTIYNLQTIGRNGMHRYNNQDHSMLTGMLAARNVCGADYDLWDVNVERSYYEEFVTKQPVEAGQNATPLISPAIV